MSRRLALLAALLALAGPGVPPQAGAAEVPMRRLEESELHVTLGVLQRRGDGQLAVEVPKMRAVSRIKGPPLAELRFTYLGPTAEVSPLASGELRRQVGLKLRAQDGCNLVYVMWRLAPREGLVVSVKRNRGQHSVRDECSNHGYRNVRPRWSVPVPRVLPGQAHSLRAELTGTRLQVHADGRPVWEGDVGPETLAFDGPVGVRSDNARLVLELLASPP